MIAKRNEIYLDRTELTWLILTKGLMPLKIRTSKRYALCIVDESWSIRVA